MWVNLCLLVLLSSVCKQLRGFELRLDNTAFFRTLKNPGLPYMTRYAWKQKDPSKFYKVTKSTRDNANAIQQDSSADFWKETTTESSVSLENMLTSTKHDHINDYIEYLTRINKIKMRTKSPRYVDRLNASIVELSKTLNISDSTANASETSLKQKNVMYFNVSSTTATKLIKKKEVTRYERKSEQPNGDIDNYIDSTKPAKTGDKEIPDGDKVLMQNNSELNESNEYLNDTETNDTLDEGYNYQNISGKKVKAANDTYNINTMIESDKYLNKSEEVLLKTYKEMESSVTFPVENIKYFKESDTELKYSDKYLKHIDKSIEEITREIEKSNKDTNKKYNGLEEVATANTKTSNFNDTKNISEAFIRLLADIQKRKSKVYDVSTTPIPHLDYVGLTKSWEKPRNVTKKFNKSIKFIIPKEDISNADAVFIVFRNLTNKNSSIDTDYSQDNSNNYFGQEKYSKKDKQIVFKPEKRRKLSKIKLSGAIPVWLGTKLKKFNKRMMLLKEIKSGFVKSSLSIQRKKRYLKIASKRISKSTNIASKKARRPLTYKANLVYELPLSNFVSHNKAPVTRNSIFSRRYRSPNRFHTNFRPIRRSKHGHVNMFNDYEPPVNELDSLKNYRNPINSLEANDIPDDQNVKQELYVFKNAKDYKEMKNYIEKFSQRSDQQNFGQIKYKKPKQIVFKSEKKRKRSEVVLDGLNPGWLSTEQKQLTQNVSPQSIIQENFMMETNLPVYRTRKRRSIKDGSNQMNKINSIRTKPKKVLRSTDYKGNWLVVLPMWQSNIKTRATRSSVFSRRHRSPNKFRIIVRPTKRDNHLGQVSVHIYRDYEPLEDVAERLKKYFSLNSSLTRDNITFSVQKNKDEPHVRRNDKDLAEIEEYVGKYLGLDKKGIVKTINSNYPSKYPRHVFLNNVNKTDNVTTAKTNVILNQKEAEIPNKFIIENANLFSDRKLNEIEDENPSVDPLTKQISSLFPRSRRLTRETERNSIMILTKKLVKNNKFYKRNTYLSPHIDQQTYLNYMNHDFPSKLDNAVSHKLNKTLSQQKENKLHKKTSYTYQKPSKYEIFQKTEKETEDNKKKFAKLSQIIPQNSFVFLKPYLWSPQQVAPITSLVKSDQNKINALNYFYAKTKNYKKPKAKLNANHANTMHNKNSTKIKYNNRRHNSSLKKEKHNHNNITAMSDYSSIKKSRKRELDSPGIFMMSLNDNNDDRYREEMFNVDIGGVGQADVSEQLDGIDDYDAEQPAINNKITLLHQHNEQLNFEKTNLKKQRSYYNHPIDLKDSMWFDPVKRPTTMWPEKSKHQNRKHFGNVTIENTNNSVKHNTRGNANLYGYENLGTARRLYSDLDPINLEESAFVHSDKMHTKYNRAIPSPHPHPLLDDYNDEFLRDTNVETNRIGVDYVNYNYLGLGIDFPDYSQAKYDKYSNFAADFPNLEKESEIVKPPEHKEIKQPKQVKNWKKDDYFYEIKESNKADMRKHTTVAEKPKRIKIDVFDHGFDYMNIEEKVEKQIIANLAKSRNTAGRKQKITTTLATRLPKSAEAINLFYNHNEKRRPMSPGYRHNSMWDSVRNERKKNIWEKSNQTLPAVHIYTEPTTEFVPKEIQFKNMNVYVHKNKELRRKNSLHNSRHLLALWSQNHDAPSENFVVDGPLDMWTHKVFHQPRPTQEQFEPLPDEEEFDRRKRHVISKKSRLVCCVLKKLDQNDLVKHVKATWGRRCDVIVFITSKGAEQHVLWEYTKAGLRFIYELHYKDADWILKADIDSYILVENLKNMVKEFNPETPLYFGRARNTDFSNFVLSKSALEILVNRNQDSETCQGSVTEGIGYCLGYLGIKTMDSRDKLGRARFYPFSPFDYDPSLKYASEEGLSTWSDYAVAFAKVNYKDMYTLDYFIYRIQPINTSKEILQRISQNITFNEAEESNTKPPHSRQKLTENLSRNFRYKGQRNQNGTRRYTLDEFQDKARQLNGLF